MAVGAASRAAGNDHELISPPRTSERPVDNGSEAPYVPVTSQELLTQMESTTTAYNDYMVASSGNEVWTEVPAGSPPYR